MGNYSYREQDYAFGQMMLTLRTNIGLTQEELAEFLGVSRRAVGAWEAGSNYPSAHHLKQLIAFAIQQHAFPIGEEANTIRSLWRVTQQKMLLDERWLAGLLAFSPNEPSPEPMAHQDRRVDWGGALAIPNFYGREWEQEQLSEWILQERCRVVGVLGLGGIGKSALSVSLMRQIAPQFEVVIWRSLRDSPTCETLIADCLRVIAPQPAEVAALDFEQSLKLLLHYLREQRALIVLDNFETLLEEGAAGGSTRTGYEAYGTLLHRISETDHQSCLLFTSREKPVVLVALEGSSSLIRLLRLTRLESKPCEALLAEKGVIGGEAEKAKLIDLYTGNPLALKIVARTIVDLFDGEIGLFLDQGEIIFGSIRSLLAEQFTRLSALEQSLLLWLAILREPATFNELAAVLVTPPARGRILEALQALYSRSLIERGQAKGSFTLQSVVLEYLTARLVEEANNELQQGTFSRLMNYGFQLAYVSEDIRQTQERLLLRPLLNNLQHIYFASARVEFLLLTSLDQMRTLMDEAQGYAPANLLVLLLLLRGDLRSLDLSHLVLRSVTLQGVEMQDASLAGAKLQDSSFTAPFDAIKAVAISSSGNYWAGSCRRGEVWLWEAHGLTLRRVWIAHADTLPAMAFSPDERFLATCGGWDSTIKLWDIASGRLLWTGRHTSRVNGVAFSPGGDRVATSSNDATLRIWDTVSGEQLQIIAHPNQASSITWSQDGSLLASGSIDGNIHLWALPSSMLSQGEATCVQTFAGHPVVVEGLAFSPDGRMLATAGWEREVKLWEVSSGSLLQKFAGPTEGVSRVAWSPDGRVLASACQDKSIWLWDVELNQYWAALQGHTAGDIGLAFTADSSSLLSGSDDGTVRLWNVSSRHCIRINRGYPDAIYDVDWSPNGAFLASAGTNGLITIWDLAEKMPLRVLSGHNRVVSTVAWSPDGSTLASSEWNSNIRLWDPTSGVALEVIEYPHDGDSSFYHFSWSPDGTQLASGTYGNGIQIVGTMAHDFPWSERRFQVWIRVVAWSPDGTQLAGGGEDGNVYLFNASDGTLLQRLTGHTGNINNVTWSPDGSLLASGGGSGEHGEVFVWNPQRSEQIAAFAEHQGVVDAVSWGQNEDILISGDGVGTLRWWDVASGECLLVREAHQGTVKAVKRSPNGTMLSSCGEDGALMIWNLQSGEHLQTLRRDRPYERMNIKGIRGLTEAQKTTLLALGAVEDSSR